MNKELAIPTDTLERVNAQQEDADLAIQLVRSWSIETSEDYDKASDFLRQIKRKQKEFKAEKDSIASPLRLAVKRVTDLFASPLSVLSEAELHLKEELKRYKDESLKRHETLLTDAQTPQEVAAAVEVLTNRPEGISERAVWRWVVADESKIPDEYWILDEKRIGAEVRRLRHEVRIPGIKVVRDTTIAVRSK